MSTVSPESLYRYSIIYNIIIIGQLYLIYYIDSRVLILYPLWVFMVAIGGHPLISAKFVHTLTLIGWSGIFLCMMFHSDEVKIVILNFLQRT